MKEAINKSLALVLWDKDDDGEEDVVVCPGIFVQKGAVYFFERHEGKNFEIREEWLEKIKTVPTYLKITFMNCEYLLSLKVGDGLENTKGFSEFGFNLPS